MENDRNPSNDKVSDTRIIECSKDRFESLCHWFHSTPCGVIASP